MSMYQFKVLLFALVLGNAFHAVPANPVEDNSSCGSGFQLRLLTAYYFFLVFASAMLLRVVRQDINTAEAAARGRALDADHDSVPAGWRRRSLRALLRLPVYLTAVAPFIALVAFQDGYHYPTGCRARAPFRAWPFHVLMCLMAAVCAVSDLMAREKN